MSPKCTYIPPSNPPGEDERDILALVEDRAKNKDTSFLFADGHIDQLLAVEAIRLLQDLAIDTSRVAKAVQQISISHAQISEDFNCLVNTDLPALADRSSDFITGLFTQALGSFVNQSSDMRNMLKQAMLDSNFTNRDIVATLSQVFKELAIPEKE